MVCCTTFLTATWIYYFLGHILPYPTFNDYITHSHHIKDLLLILSQLYRYMFQRKMSPCFLFLLPFHTFNVAWLRLIVFVNCLQHVLLHHVPHEDKKLSSFANHKAYYKKYVSIQHLIHYNLYNFSETQWLLLALYCGFLILLNILKSIKALFRNHSRVMHILHVMLFSIV